MNTIPYVMQNNHQIVSDIYSSLLENRIIFLDGEINTQSASLIMSQLLYLESKDSNVDIQLYINSTGGSVSDGLAIIDTMNTISCDVSCIVTGMAASMAALILSSGTKGKRYALPHAEIMIHQPMSMTQGQVSDLKIAVQHVQQVKEILCDLLVELTGQKKETIHKDMDRDKWFNAKNAKSYGLIDAILKKDKLF